MDIGIARERHRPCLIYIFTFAILWLGFNHSKASFQATQCDIDSNQCVVKINKDWCFEATEEGITNTKCPDDAIEFQRTMDAHLQQRNFSIAYYGIDDNLQRPDGPDYNVPLRTSLGDSTVMHLCLSGITGTPSNVTICMNVTGNDDIVGLNSFATICKVALVPDITQGCYAAEMPSTMSQSDSTSHTTMPSSSASVPKSSQHSNSMPTGHNGNGDDSENNKSDPAVVKDIIVPVVVGVMGLLAAAIGAGFVIRHRRRHDERVLHQINIGPLELHVGDSIKRALAGSSTPPSTHGSMGDLATPALSGGRGPQTNMVQDVHTSTTAQESELLIRLPHSQSNATANTAGAQISSSESLRELHPCPPVEPYGQGRSNNLNRLAFSEGTVDITTESLTGIHGT